MSKKAKQLISLLITLAMMAAIVPNALAADNRLQDGSTMAKITFQLMKYVDGKSDGANDIFGGMETAPIVEAMDKDDFNLQKGATFIVGVKISELANIKKASEGLYSLGFNIKYNKDYIEYAETSSTGSDVNSGAFIAKTVNRFGGMNTANPFYMFNPTYKIYTDGTGAHPESGTITYSVQANGVPSYKGGVSVTPNPEATPPVEADPDEGMYIAALKFKLRDDVEIPTSNVPNIIGLDPELGTFSIGFGQDGTGGSYESSNTTANDIRTLIKVEQSSLDLYGSVAGAPRIQSISTATGNKIKKQYVGKAFDSAGIKLQQDLSDGTNTTHKDILLTDEKLVFKYADAADTVDSATDTDLEALPGTWKDTDNGKKLYAVYDGTYFVEVGTLEVAADSVSSITIDNTSTFAQGTYFDSTNVLDGFSATTPETLTATITWSSGTIDANVPYSDFGSKNLALVKVNTEDSNKLAALTATDKYTAGAAGSNTFYVIESANIGKTVDELGTYVKPSISNANAVTADTLTLEKYESGISLIYSDGATINVPDTAKFDISKKSDTTVVEDKTLTEIKSAFGNDAVTFYYADTNADAYNASKAIVPGITQYSDTDMNGKYLMAVSTKDIGQTGAKSVVIGQFGAKAISTDSDDLGANGYAVTGTGTDNTTEYGDKIDSTSAPSIHVKYNDGSEGDIAGLAALKAAGVTAKIEGTNTVVDATTVLTPAMNGKKLEFYVNDGTNDVKIATSAAISVKKKDVKFTVTGTPSKEYNGKTDVEAADLTLAITAGDMLASDQANASKLAVDGLTFAYYNKNVGTTHTVTVTGTAVAKASATGTTDDATAFNANYNLVPDTGFTVSGGTTTLTAKGEITAKTLTVSSITGVPSVQQGATGADLTVSGTLTLTTSNSDMCDGDNLTLKYKATYADANTAPSTPSVQIVVTGTGLGLYGTDKDNYTLDTANIPPTTGTVTNKSLSTISVNTPPSKVEYEYPSIKLDLTGMKISYNYDSGTPTVRELGDFIDDGGIITVTDANNTQQTITKTNYANVIVLPYGDAVTININYSGKSTSQAVAVKRKPININDITFSNITKVYGGTATGDVAFKTGDIENADGGKIKVNATYTFASENPGDNIPVTITGMSLGAVTEGDKAFENYQLVYTDTADGNKVKPVTAATAKDATGSITKTANTNKPNKPEAKRDELTNDIIISGPIGDNLEYSIDGTNYQPSPRFTGLTQDKACTITARYKATATAEASTPSDALSLTTFKNHVIVYKVKNTDNKILKEVYTDATSAESASDLNSNVLPSKPTRFKAYYDDLEGTKKTEFPKTIGETTKLYITQTSGGGGGGGGAAITIKLDQTKYEGPVGDTVTIKPTVTGSTAKPKWTSSDEKVATVDENGVVTFVGKGTATIKVNVSGITKTVTVTATDAPEATATPTPTDAPTPTNAPIIDKQYTAPYASGYDDGNFLPDDYITRAELATMMARLSNKGDIMDGAYSASFPDVSADAWYNKYIGYLEGLDVLSGYEDGNFRPDNTITRGEVCAVIARAMKYGVSFTPGMFSDVEDSDWAKDYITTLASMDIVSGYEDGTFGTYSPITRAEAVAIINRVLDPSHAVVSFTPNDISGHWAEADIMLAVNERELENAGTAAPAPAEPTTPAEPAAPTAAPAGDGEPAAPAGPEMPSDMPTGEPETSDPAAPAPEAPEAPAPTDAPAAN